MKYKLYVILHDVKRMIFETNNLHEVIYNLYKYEFGDEVCKEEKKLLSKSKISKVGMFHIAYYYFIVDDDERYPFGISNYWLLFEEVYK